LNRESRSSCPSHATINPADVKGRETAAAAG
jgi:hypothetical protein